MEIVGQIRFDGYTLDVYEALDTPLFMAVEVAELLGYADNSISEMLKMVEADEHLLVAMRQSGLKIKVHFVTELGLYNILSQSREPIARKWRRAIHSNLILMRKQRQLTIEGQFEEWDAIADNLYIDPETGILMEFRTVPGGDVEVVEFEE